MACNRGICGSGAVASRRVWSRQTLSREGRSCPSWTSCAWVAYEMELALEDKTCLHAWY